MSGCILVLADSDELAELIPTTLESLGHTAFVTRDVDEGLNWIRNNGVDLVLVDTTGDTSPLISPSFSADLAAHHIPVLALTANDESPPIENVQVFDYVASPFRTDDLEVKVNHAIRIKRFQDELPSLVDPLTNQLNRSAGEIRLAEEVSRVIRYGRELSCCAALLAPNVPEEDLQVFAGLVRENVRLSDVVSRWESNGLLVVLPETGPFGAVRVGENLKRIAGLRKLEVHFGAASYVDGDEWGSLASRAFDAAREAASRDGNPVLLAEITTGESQIRFKTA